MGRRKETTPEQISDARLKWLYAQSRKANEGYNGAVEAGSWSAATAYLREERALRDQIDAEKIKRAEMAAAADDRPMTPEERAAALSKLVESASDDELDVAVREWLRRRRYRMTVLEDGTLTVYPLGEEPSLRLVEGG